VTHCDISCGIVKSFNKIKKVNNLFFLSRDKTRFN
jgi:hypothetical protein